MPRTDSEGRLDLHLTAEELLVLDQLTTARGNRSRSDTMRQALREAHARHARHEARRLAGASGRAAGAAAATGPLTAAGEETGR